MRLVVDANIAFRALISRGGEIRAMLGPALPAELFAPNHLFVEMFKHKDAIVRASGLEEDDVLGALHVLLENIRFLEEASIPIGIWTEAYRLCRDVDPKDTPYVAMTLQLEDGQLWTFDCELREGLRAKGWNQFFPNQLTL